MKKEIKSKIVKSSLITFIAATTLSPIGVALFNNWKKEQDLKDQFFANVQNYDQVENMNNAVLDMFWNTKNLIPLGSIKKGHNLTPYGILATYASRVNAYPGAPGTDQNSNPRGWDDTLVLIGWDGSILWQAYSLSQIHIESVKYNFSSNVIFAVRSQDRTGFGEGDWDKTINFSIQDARTGENLYDSWTRKGEAGDKIAKWKGNKKPDGVNIDYHDTTSAFFQDVITLGNGDLLWTYFPNPMHMKLSNTDQYLPDDKTYVNFLKNGNWDKPNARIIHIKKSEIDAVRNKVKDAKINPTDITKSVLSLMDNVGHRSDKYRLISAPFFTSNTYSSSAPSNNTDFALNYFAVDVNNPSSPTIKKYHLKIDKQINGNYSQGWDVISNDNGQNKENKITIQKDYWRPEYLKWSKEYLNANLLPIRNIFDESIITFQYPYASRKNRENINVGSGKSDVNVPIFNVVQLDFSNQFNGVGNGDRNISFDFGTQILNHWETSKLYEKDQSNGTDNANGSQYVFWNPWPFANTRNGDYVYSNQSYNRLISVSPFDGTVVYAARPNNIRLHKESNNTYKDIYSTREENNQLWGSFWVGKTLGTDKGKITNLTINNSDSWFKQSLSPDIIGWGGDRFETFYKNGFWFDPANNNNLYFQVTGSYKNKFLNNNIVSSAPGFISVKSQSYLFPYIEMNQLTNIGKVLDSSSDNMGIMLDPESYSTFYSSRADLKKWYPRTWQNISRGSNTYKNGDVILDSSNISVDDFQDKKVVLKGFGKQNGQEFQTNASVDLYDVWKVSSKYKFIAPVKGPKISVVKEQSDTNKLKTKIKLSLSIDLSKNEYIKSKDLTKAQTYEIIHNIDTKSYEFLNSWSDNFKLDTTNKNSNSLQVVVTGSANSNITDWASGNNLGYFNGQSFTQLINYEIRSPQSNPLRLEFEIDYNPNNLDVNTNEYIKKLKDYQSGKFTKSYPVWPQNNETSFNSILQEYIEWKAKNVDWTNTNDILGDFSPGNISIKAYMKLNPYWEKNTDNKIYEVDQETNVVYDNAKVAYIYNDRYTNSRYVYKQNSKKWSENSQYGFGSNVSQDIQFSWNSIVPTTNYKATITDKSKFNDEWVREPNKSTSDIFAVAFNDDNTKINLSLKDKTKKTWVENHFKNFNQLLGRKVKFQYSTVDNVNTWVDLETKMDTDFNNVSWDSENGYQLNISSIVDKSKIANIRFILEPITNSNNNIVDTSAIQNDQIFISDAIKLEKVEISIDYNKDTTLDIQTNNNNYINGATKDQIKTALQQIEEKLLQDNNITDADKKSYIELKFSLTENNTNNNSWKTAEEMASELYSKLTSYSQMDSGGIIDLFDKDKNSSKSNITKIFIKFHLKNPNLATIVNLQETNWENNKFIKKTNNKFYINLKQYIDELQKNPITIEKENEAEGTIKKINLPDHSGALGTSFLAGWTFQQMETLFKKFNIDIKYSTKDNDWKDSISDIKNYNTANPKLQIKFIYNDDRQIDLSLNGSTNVNGEQIIDLKLNVPLVIKLDDNTFNTAFKNQKPVTGNTYKINVDSSKEQSFINQIKTLSTTGTTQFPDPNPWDKIEEHLEIQYALGNENTFRNATEFKEYYEKQINVVQQSNKVSVKLVLKNSNNSPFKLDPNAEKTFTLIDDGDTDFRIFILSTEYENEMNAIQVRGSNTKLEVVLPPRLKNIKDGQVTGLKIQFSLKPGIGYDDQSNGSIDNGWVDEPPTSFTTQKILSIRVINSEDKYVYGGVEGTQTKEVHTVDLSEITQLIDVDKNWFNSEQIIVNSNNQDQDPKYLKDLQVSDLEKWEDAVWGKSNAIKNNSDLKNSVQIKYQIEGINEEFDAQSLVNKIKQMEQDYSSDSLGIVHLWNGRIGTKIIAKFTKKEGVKNIVFISNIDEPDSTNTDLEGTANTYKLKTLVDLTSYITKLKTTKIPTEFDKNIIGNINSFTPPSMDSNNGFLGSKTYDQIANRLNRIGITFKFNAAISKKNEWKTKSETKQYDKNKALLYLGFEFSDQLRDQTNVSLKVSNEKDKNIESTTLNNDIILTLDAPIELTIDNTKLSQLAFKGDTKNISNVNDIKNKVNTLVEEAKNSNKPNVSGTLNAGLNDLTIEIRFSLNNLKLQEPNGDSEDGIWFTIEKLSQILQLSTTNYDTNKVLAKFYVKDNPQVDAFDKYHFSNKDPQTINQENKSSKSEFNIYIHHVEQTREKWIQDNLKLYGSQENFEITKYNEWKAQIPKGLSVQYNVTPSANDKSKPDNNEWKNNFDDAKPINSTRDYWIRFEVGQAYVFEGALQTDPSHSDAIKLDASNIQVALKIKNEWLRQIVLNGNLKNLTINEDQAIKAIKDAGMMPIDGIIQVEYTINSNEWLTKDLFTSKLQEIDNDKTSNDWFILRENVKVRFALNKELNDKQNPKYILDIDGVNITENNSNNPGINIITNDLNNNVKGYVNLDRFEEFKASNFKVIGTNITAFLHISNVNKLNEKLNPYSSSNVFSILYKSDESGAYETTNKVWTPGQELQAKQQLNGDYQKRWFGIEFKLTNSDYELYKDNAKVANNAYEIKTPDIKVEISVEIINPLIGKSLVVSYLGENNKPIFYNAEGGFKVTIENKTFKEFIDQSGLLSDQKEALELAYYVSQNSLSDEELTEITRPESIATYSDSTDKYNVWKTLNTEQDANTRNLNLKVNDFIVIALRIKKDKITSESNLNGYVLKDNEHTPTGQKRVFGYKIHTDNIDVDWQSLRLRNVGLAENASYGLDGYAMLDQVQLKPTNNDINNDYLNVGLSLDFFNEFHLNNNDQVLVSASGARLVKRKTEGATQDGNYKNADGQDITDKNGNTIPILYTDKDNGILSPPTQANTKTRTHTLIEQTSNNYTLELNSNEENALYSFFKNQEIAITFTNKKGDADQNQNDLYDYYVDKEDQSKTYKITDLIKFPIANDKLVQYSFNSEEFTEFIKNPDNLTKVYVNSHDPDKKPINSQSKMIYTYKVNRTAENEAEKTLLTIDQIIQQIKDDFGSKVKLKTTYTPVNGASQDVPTNRLDSITTLQNGDRFKIEILSANENDLIFAQQPAPLIFTINGLYEQDIEQSSLKFLRVEQKGTFEWEGTFNIYVDDPSSDKDDDIPIESLLQGYKFLVKVWNKDKEVKQDWTNDFGLLTNLSNGDKIEWKLVAPSGAPVENAYYNTVANMEKHDANNNQYSFIQVTKKGNNSTTIYQESIGKNPETDNQYPENSGFIISDLIEKTINDITPLKLDQFINIMNYMNFGYSGINGLGSMVSERNVANVILGSYNYSRATYSLKDLIEQKIITFYANDIEFSWTQVLDRNGNWISSPGNLFNGDKITVRYQMPTMASYYEWKAPDVFGLKDKIDNMSLLTYVGITMASIATLGTFGIIYWIAKRRKLKNKK